MADDEMEFEFKGYQCAVWDRERDDAWEDGWMLGLRGGGVSLRRLGIDEDAFWGREGKCEVVVMAVALVQMYGLLCGHESIMTMYVFEAVLREGRNTDIQGGTRIGLAAQREISHRHSRWLCEKEENFEFLFARCKETNISSCFC